MVPGLECQLSCPRASEQPDRRGSVVPVTHRPGRLDFNRRTLRRYKGPCIT